MNFDTSSMSFLGLHVIGVHRPSEDVRPRITNQPSSQSHVTTCSLYKMNQCGAELYKQRTDLEDSLWKGKAVILLKHTSSCQAMETQKSGKSLPSDFSFIH